MPEPELPPHLEAVVLSLRRYLASWRPSDQYRCRRCNQHVPTTPTMIRWEVTHGESRCEAAGEVPVHPTIGIALTAVPAKLKRFERKEAEHYPQLCEDCANLLFKLLHIEGLRYKKSPPSAAIPEIEDDVPF